MERREVSFFSEGAQIAGELYVPADTQENMPAVVLCHGFAGIKEILLPPYSGRLAENGFVALTFDYRGFGGSEGERGRLVPVEQMADIRNALTYMQTLKEVDSERIALWGTSFGGANAVSVAAIDKRVKAIAVQLTFASGERMVKDDLDTAQIDKLEATLRKAQVRAVTKNKFLRLSPDQIITDEDSATFFVKIVERYPQARTKIPLATLQHIMEHNAEDHISEVSCPVLIIAAEHDIVCPPGESKVLFDRANEPKRFVLLKGCRHYDAYEGESFEKGSSEIVRWFSEHL
jgi:alpha-beta hydrolase superfamily lysophospholipase